MPVRLRGKRETNSDSLKLFAELSQSEKISKRFGSKEEKKKTVPAKALVTQCC
jgi:hypothetical protein